ncbi:hypothetical protein GCM10020001_096540 [Nonomuraea salmonea]
MVDEVEQPAFLPQIAQEAELAGRITHGDQVLQERDLHGRAFDEHAAMPAEGGLFLQEDRVDSVTVTLFERDGQGQVGGPEADANEVVDVLLR